MNAVTYRSTPAFAIGGELEGISETCDLNPHNLVVLPRRVVERMRLHLEDLLPVFGDRPPRELVSLQHDLVELLKANERPGHFQDNPTETPST